MQHSPPATEPPGPETSRHRAAKKRGVLLGLFGLTLGSLILLGFKLAGEVDVSFLHIAAFQALILASFGFLWLIPHRGWDRRLTWDPHFLFMPSLAGVLLLAVLLVAAPEMRLLIFASFFIVLLFWVGIASFGDVVLFAVFATAAYATSIAIVLATGRAVISWSEIFGSVLFLASVGVFAAFVLERARVRRREARSLREELHHLASMDPLTELPNRRAFSQLAEMEAARLARHGGDCVLAILDLDHFKAVNDEAGHLTGDEVLRRIGVILRERVRGADVVARLGGEEFGLVLPETKQEAALALLDRLRVEVAELDVGDLGISRPITLSGGLSAFAAGESYFEPWRRADQALYRAKETGRNQIRAAPAPGAGSRLAGEADSRRREPDATVEEDAAIEVPLKS